MCCLTWRRGGNEYGVEVDVYREACCAEGSSRSSALLQSVGTTPSARIPFVKARSLSSRQIDLQGSSRIPRRRTEIPQPQNPRRDLGWTRIEATLARCGDQVRQEA